MFVRGWRWRELLQSPRGSCREARVKQLADNRKIRSLQMLGTEIRTE